MTNAALVVDMLLAGTLRIQQLAQVLNNAQTRGTDVTKEELDVLQADFQAADERLSQKIAAAKGG